MELDWSRQKTPVEYTLKMLLKKGLQNMDGTVDRRSKNSNASNRALLAGRFEDEISNLESSIFRSTMFCSLSTVFSFDIS